MDNHQAGRPPRRYRPRRSARIRPYLLAWEHQESAPVASWHCPVAGCCFASLYPMKHPCPLRDPAAEDLGPAVAPWGASADTVRTVPLPVVGVRA